MGDYVEAVVGNSKRTQGPSTDRISRATDKRAIPHFFLRGWTDSTYIYIDSAGDQLTKRMTIQKRPTANKERTLFDALHNKVPRQQHLFLGKRPIYFIVNTSAMPDEVVEKETHSWSPSRAPRKDYSSPTDDLALLRRADEHLLSRYSSC